MDEIKIATSMIEQEIDWCEKNKDGFDGDEVFPIGFIAGLQQALYLINEYVSVEETVVYYR